MVRFCLLYILICLFVSAKFFAQTSKSAMLPCATYEAMEYGFQNNSALKENYLIKQAQLEADYAQILLKRKSLDKTATPIYTVPVVFHIMGTQIISDQVFVNLISYINNDFGKKGSDVNSISPQFASLYQDAEIKFALAQRDPLGKCSNGIIRHNEDNMYWSQITPNFKYSGVGANRWPTNRYLNVYVVECISSASGTYTCPTTSGAFIGGYTYLPGSTPFTSNGNMGDAIVILRNQLAQNNSTDSRTMSHEIGHWLNLAHTFGNTNQPGISCGDDNVSDTPITKGYFSSCPTSIGGNTCDPSGNANVENIMDYSSCPRMFTQGQIDRMRSTLVSNVGGRNNLSSSSNLLFTGLANGYTCSPTSDFSVNKLMICANNSITYTSLSQVGENGTLLWSFEGGVPASSTSFSQVVTYPNPGTYSVSLKASNSASVIATSKTSYINIVNSGSGIVGSALYDFEGPTIPAEISVNNLNSSTVTWQQNSSAGANGTLKSLFIDNASANNTAGHIDILETPLFDFTNTSGITLSFYYAYAKRTATQLDTFKVEYSLDCGGTWSKVLGIQTPDAMASVTGGTLTTAFVPTSAQWALRSIPAGLLTVLNNKPNVKFRFFFKTDVNVGKANNIYVDQINISGNKITSLEQLEKEMELILFPDPTPSSSVLEFTLNNHTNTKISLIDLTGRVLEETIKMPDAEGKVNYILNSNQQLAPGIYFINIEAKNQRITKKLVIQ